MRFFKNHGIVVVIDRLFYCKMIRFIQVQSFIECDPFREDYSLMVTMICVPQTPSLPRFVRYIQCRFSQFITFDEKWR
jgi:hypothetical protein